MTPHYAPRDRSWLWLTLGIMTVITLACFAGRQFLRNHDAAVRAAVFAQAELHAARSVTMQRTAWARRFDSLATTTRQRDTVLVTRIQRVRELVTRADTVRDTVSATAALQQCTALASDCEAFRSSATTALLVADSLHRADSLRVHLFALQKVASSDSIRLLTTQRDRRLSWPRALLGTLAFSGAAYLAGRLTP